MSARYETWARPFGDIRGQTAANLYRIGYMYQYGVRKTAQYQDAGGTDLSFKSLDLDIDLNTGLSKASRDTSAIKTDFEYDTMGRLRHSKPVAPHDGWTETVYTRATSSTSLARTNVYRRSNGGATTLAQSETRADSFGRLSEELVLMANGTWSTRKTTYNGLGLRASVSELGDTAKTTQFLAYDPFGRPGKVTPPDGTAHDVGLAYAGDRVRWRTVNVATSQDSGTIFETQAVTAEIYDRQGRLFQVVEPAGGLTATYGYDVGNRLKSVATTNGPTTQTRLFTYDNRGFLRTERHPEKGNSGDGTVTYSNYDARGHAGRKVDGGHDLTLTYDRAERVTQVRETGGAERVLKAFTFGTSNVSGVWDNGKRKTADRYNYTTLPGASTAQIRETSFYAGRHGRVSSRDTLATVNGTPRESFRQSWIYNDLGQTASIGYPDCTHSPCAGQVPDPDAIGFSYANGFLASVPNHANSITYHPNAMVAQIAHYNGVTETHGYDPNGMPRPSSIQAALGQSLRWSSGAYQYDGAGSVTKMGDAIYLYDLPGRLVYGSIYTDAMGGGTMKYQDYDYDAFGNILEIGGTLGRATPTSSSTNRLTGTVSYDGCGNLTSWNTNSYAYDAFD
ncbi:MAG: hypothetical protein ACRDSJ_06400, partial [Rubrobacteraceae bacterium]